MAVSVGIPDHCRWPAAVRQAAAGPPIFVVLPPHPGYHPDTSPARRGQPMRQPRSPATLLILACAGFLLLPPSGRGQAPKVGTSEARFEVAVEKDILVPVRDGTRLALDLYRPVPPGKYPVLLARPPHNPQGTATGARRLPRRGSAL